MLQVPPGFIFQPSDEVLLLSYLLPKVKGEPLPYPDVVKEIDLYQMRPDDIWTKFIGPSFGNSDLFFITKLRLANEQIRCVRTVDGGGTWSQEDCKVIYSGDTNITSIGSKRRFSFKSREPQQRGGWVMHEYRLNCSAHSSYVLCRLRKNKMNCNKRKAEYVLRRLRKNKTNCNKRKAESELQDSHTEASEHKQGEIEISGAQSQPQPQLQDHEQSEIERSEAQSHLQPQLQYYEQSEIEKTEAQSRIQTQVQDPTNLVFSSNFYQPFISTTTSAHEQGEIGRSGAWFQSQHQDFLGAEIYGAQPQPQPDDSSISAVVYYSSNHHPHANHGF